MKIDFYLRFHTQFGQRLAVIGNIPALGSNDPLKATPLSFFNHELWHLSIEIDDTEIDRLRYQYILIDKDGEWKKEGEKNRELILRKAGDSIMAVDTWNDESNYEN